MIAKIVLSVVFIVLALGGAAEARADDVVITGGFVSIGGVFPPGRGTFRSIAYSFGGSNFTVTGGTSDGTMQNVMSPCIFSPCGVGNLVSANSLVELQGIGTATVDGVTYSLIQPFGSFFTFTAPDVAIPGGGATVTIATPFTMTGNLNIFSGPPFEGPPVFSMTVSGSGLATLTLQQIESGYVLTTIHYDFQPVPEPATLLLFGTGLAATALLAWRRRKR